MHPADDDRKARRTQAIAGAIRRGLDSAATGERAGRATDDGHTGRRAGRAIDVGAGAGNVSLALGDVFDEIVLVDVSPDALAQAADAVAAAGGSTSARITTALLDLSDPACQRDGLGPVDVVYTAMAMHHIADLDQLFDTVHDLLRPGGRFFGADLDPEEGAFHAHLPGYDGHHGFDRQALATRLAAVGLVVDSVETVHVDRKPVDGVDRDFPIFLISATRPATSP